MNSNNRRFNNKPRQMHTFRFTRAQTRHGTNDEHTGARAIRGRPDSKIVVRVARRAVGGEASVARVTVRGADAASNPEACGAAMKKLQLTPKNTYLQQSRLQRGESEESLLQSTCNERIKLDAANSCSQEQCQPTWTVNAAQTASPDHWQHSVDQNSRQQMAHHTETENTEVVVPARATKRLQYHSLTLCTYHTDVP